MRLSNKPSSQYRCANITYMYHHVYYQYVRCSFSGVKQLIRQRGLYHNKHTWYLV